MSVLMGESEEGVAVLVKYFESGYSSLSAAEKDKIGCSAFESAANTTKEAFKRHAARFLGDLVGGLVEHGGDLGVGQGSAAAQVGDQQRQ